MQKKKIFISFSAKDISYVKRLKSHIEKSHFLQPLIVTERREVGKLNTEKVANGIKECDYIMPIITSQSINSQWLNQEIGYASAINKLIIPIIEDSCFEKLKGFINKEIDQPYIFKSNENKKTERSNFRICMSKIILDLENEVKPFVLNEISNEELQYLLKGKIVKFNNNSRSVLVGTTIHHIENGDVFDFLIGKKLKREDNRIMMKSEKHTIGKEIHLYNINGA